MQHTAYIPYIQGIFLSLCILKIKTERKGRCDTAIFSIFLKVNCRDYISQKCPVSVVSVFKNLGPFRCHCFMAVCRKCNHRIVGLINTLFSTIWFSGGSWFEFISHICSFSFFFPVFRRQKWIIIFRIMFSVVFNHLKLTIFVFLLP